MPRYVALLRGVSPMNANMAELRRAFVIAGFANVKTVLASGNVAFDSSRRSEARLVRDIEGAMQRELGRTFSTILRSTQFLQELIEADPFAGHRLPPKAKRVVTFLREPGTAPLPLPREVDGATILAVKGREVFTAYVPSRKGAVFMGLIESTFGKDVTTRSWGTVCKCAKA